MAVGDCLPESRRRLGQRAGRMTLLQGLSSASTRGDAGVLGQRRCDCKADPCDDDARESGKTVEEWVVAKKVAAANRRGEVAGTSVAPKRAWRQHHHQRRQLDQTSTRQVGS